MCQRCRANVSGDLGSLSRAHLFGSEGTEWFLTSGGMSIHTCRDQKMYVALLSFPAFKSKPYNKGSGHFFFDSERLLPPSTPFSFLS